METLDQNVLNFFINHRIDWLSFIVLIITYTGGHLLIGGLTVLTTISLYIHRQTSKILPLLITVSGSAVSVFLIKHFFNRPRPVEAALYLETSSSFPSGHATLGMALYGFLFYLIWKHEEHHLKNPMLWFLPTLIILLGISRLYLGVHHLSDVLAGWLLGLSWIWIALRVLRSKP